MRFLAGHAVSYAETIPYWPVRELLRGWLGLGVSESEARVRLELRAELASVLGHEADEAYPFLAGLLGLALESDQEQRMRDFASDAVQRQTIDWLYELVSALARKRPLCLVLEDLHWSDEATLSLHARKLAEADAGGQLPEELAQLLAERAGGNPYFVGEAIRDLYERGALTLDDGRVVLAGGASIPAAVQEALQARLDRLDAEARELLTTAAVTGVPSACHCSSGSFPGLGCYRPSQSCNGSS